MAGSIERIVNKMTGDLIQDAATEVSRSRQILRSGDDYAPDKSAQIFQDGVRHPLQQASALQDHAGTFLYNIDQSDLKTLLLKMP